ncbi:PH domain-containing protein [Fluviicola sp.]|uniref:PH domain-containing protein n=1 Tax=Fluviicola sp. TaxID=1917219 RepID=UPI0031D32947
MKFSSRKSVLFHILVLGFSALVISFSVFGIVFGWLEKPDFWVFIPVSLIVTLLLWIYFGTYYQLTETELIYRSGPIRGKIRIDAIREIEKGKTLYTGMKPATASKGLIIKYGKYDEIYISPRTNDSFIKEILKLNPEIVISD